MEFRRMREYATKSVSFTVIYFGTQTHHHGTLQGATIKQSITNLILCNFESFNPPAFSAAFYVAVK